VAGPILRVGTQPNQCALGVSMVSSGIGTVQMPTPLSAGRHSGQLIFLVVPTYALGNLVSAARAIFGNLRAIGQES